MNNVLPVIPATKLAELGKLITAKMGLSFPQDRWSDLERGIAAAAHDAGCRKPEEYADRLLSSPWAKNQIETLASCLTVGETYFFREKEVFQAMENHILPELLRSGRGTNQRLRIWSAGCCTGEEPYSIAILLAQFTTALKNWSIQIRATDINPHFLQKAAEGVYKDWSFRCTPQLAKDRMFHRKKNGSYEIVPEIRKMVAFSYLNLAEDVYPATDNDTAEMNIIFCRNVLMYFAPESAAQVIQNFYRALVDGGWLIVSPTEAASRLYAQFTTVHVDGAILYKKECDKPQGAIILPRDPAPATFMVPPLLDFPVAITPAAFTATSVPVLIPAEEKKQERPQPKLFEEAQTLYAEYRHQEAVDKLLSLLAEHPQHSPASALLARLYADQGQLAQALTYCEQGIAGDKLNPGLYYLQAMIFQESGANDQAKASLLKALYLDQSFVLAHFTLGNLSLRMGQEQEAHRHFRIALSLAQAYRPAAILPESEGMTASRLIAIIHSICR